MKQLWKRNAVAAVILVLVCAAIFLNGRYAEKAEKPAKVLGQAQQVDAAADDAAEVSGEAGGKDYFASARLTRQQSRDEALSLLKSASAAEDASQETIDSAMRAISAMASDSMTETQIENLLLAKDFSECVVYITEEGITVAVPAPADGLSTAQVATITDVIVSETDYTAPQIKVIEVKADAQ